MLPSIMGATKIKLIRTDFWYDGDGSTGSKSFEIVACFPNCPPKKKCFKVIVVIAHRFPVWMVPRVPIVPNCLHALRVQTVRTSRDRWRPVLMGVVETGWDFWGTGEGSSGEGITICFESEKHLFENDCGHKKNTHLMKASVPEWWLRNWRMRCFDAAKTI